MTTQSDPISLNCNWNTAPYYVVSEDTFMSGWGKASSLRNILIFPCDSYEMAETVEDNARNRTDTINVRIVTTKPRYFPPNSEVMNGYEHCGIYAQVKTPEDYQCWYKEGYFYYR